MWSLAMAKHVEEASKTPFRRAVWCVKAAKYLPKGWNTSLKSAECAVERRVPHLQVAKTENKKEV